MDRCLECGKDIQGSAAACEGCGEPTPWAVPGLPFDGARMEAREPEAADAPVVSVAADMAPTETAAAEVPVVPALVAGASPAPKRSLMPVLVAAVVVAGALVTLAMLRAQNAPAATAVAASAPAEPRTSAPSPVQPVAAVHVDSSEADRPRWSADARAAWLPPGSRGAAFEVAAENTVGVWMRNVRPSLVVRCTGGRTEVFVFTQTPARIEPGTEDHTVTVGIDDDEAFTELWPDSVEHDALFAPDGTALARRLLGARSMRFGFTPHNAATAVARFHVEGLDELLRPSVRECGWR